MRAVAVPLLGIFSLLALFFKMPEVPELFSFFTCKTCTSHDPYLPLMGAGYFAALTAIAFLFPGFPKRHFAFSGLVWSLVLAVIFTYKGLPKWCGLCLFTHSCHILMWLIWIYFPVLTIKPASSIRDRLCFVLFAPISVMALFSCLNLTFMAYGFKIQPLTFPLQPGEALPSLAAKIGISLIDEETIYSCLVVNFVSPNCPFCKEQLAILDSIAAKLSKNSTRFINVTPHLSQELVEKAPHTEWMQDKEGNLRELFKVSGYPTLFIVKEDGKIAKVISGVPEQFSDDLLILVK